MEDLSHRGNITYRAIQRAKPGRWSWIASVIFAASLLLTAEFRDSIVEQLHSQEIEAALVSTVDGLLLVFSIALAATAALVAWRVWWTLGLIVAAALGLPDVSARVARRLLVGMKRIRHALRLIPGFLHTSILVSGKAVLAPARSVGQWSKRHGVLILGGISSTFSSALSGLMAGLRYLSRPLAFTTSFISRALRFAVKCLWLATYTAFYHLGKGIFRVINSFSTGIFAVSAAAGLGWDFLSRHVSVGVAILLNLLKRRLVYVGNGTYFAIRIPFVFLNNKVIWFISLIGKGVSLLWKSSLKVLIHAVRPLEVTAKLIFSSVRNTLYWTGRRLWIVGFIFSVHLLRYLSLPMRGVWIGTSILLRCAWTGVLIFLHCSWIGITATSYHLSRVIGVAVRYTWLGILIALSYIWLAFAKVLSNLWLGILALFDPISRGQSTVVNVVKSSFRYLWRRAIPFVGIGNAARGWIWLRVSAGARYVLLIMR